MNKRERPAEKAYAQCMPYTPDPQFMHGMPGAGMQSPYNMPYPGTMNPGTYGCAHGHMPGMGMQSQYYPTMPQEQMENMYPKTYCIIQPEVECQCDMMQMKYGMMYTPSREQVEATADEIYKSVCPMVEDAIRSEEKDKETKERQMGLFGGRILRDFITVLLLRELISRRPNYGYMPYYHGYGQYPAY